MPDDRSPKNSFAECLQIAPYDVASASPSVSMSDSTSAEPGKVSAKRDQCFFVHKSYETFFPLFLPPKFQHSSENLLHFSTSVLQKKIPPQIIVKRRDCNSPSSRPTATLDSYTSNNIMRVPAYSLDHFQKNLPHFSTNEELNSFLKEGFVPQLSSSFYPQLILTSVVLCILVFLGE